MEFNEKKDSKNVDDESLNFFLLTANKNTEENVANFGVNLLKRDLDKQNWYKLFFFKN